MQYSGTKSCVYYYSSKEFRQVLLSLLYEPAMTYAFSYSCWIVHRSSTLEMIWIHHEQRLKMKFCMPELKPCHFRSEEYSLPKEILNTKVIIILLKLFS
jgi:hypothetical protein